MTARRRHLAGSAVLAAALLALAAGCSSADPPPAAEPTSAAPLSIATTAVPSTTSAAPAPSPSTAAAALPPVLDPSLPRTIAPVPQGELTGFRVDRGGTTLLRAGSSGLARYNASENCEVPGLPCYDAPTFDKVARIDLGAPPTVPGRDTTFVTGHSNRYHPDDVTKGVFSHLQDVRTGDVVTLTTTRGVFVYAVTTVLSVPFDKLTSTPEVVTVRPDTVVAISCIVAPNHSEYLGNYVVVGALRGSAPK
ncbi:MAG TPA: sortase [Lapillicoccus sp.]|nr:sortase [Lapillicoccus sp.]